MWHVTDNMWHLTYFTWHITCNLLCEKWHEKLKMWHLICYIWHITCQKLHTTSSMTCYETGDVTWEIWHAFRKYLLIEHRLYSRHTFTILPIGYWLHSELEVSTEALYLILCQTILSLSFENLHYFLQCKVPSQGKDC